MGNFLSCVGKNRVSVLPKSQSDVYSRCTNQSDTSNDDVKLTERKLVSSSTPFVVEPAAEPKNEAETKTNDKKTVPLQSTNPRSLLVASVTPVTSSESESYVRTISETDFGSVESLTDDKTLAEVISSSICTYAEPKSTSTNVQDHTNKVEVHSIDDTPKMGKTENDITLMRPNTTPVELNAKLEGNSTLMELDAALRELASVTATGDTSIVDAETSKAENPDSSLQPESFGLVESLTDDKTLAEVISSAVDTYTAPKGNSTKVQDHTNKVEIPSVDDASDTISMALDMTKTENDNTLTRPDTASVERNVKLEGNSTLMELDAALRELASVTATSDTSMIDAKPKDPDSLLQLESSKTINDICEMVSSTELDGNLAKVKPGMAMIETDSYKVESTSNRGDASIQLQNEDMEDENEKLVREEQERMEHETFQEKESLANQVKSCREFTSSLDAISEVEPSVVDNGRQPGSGCSSSLDDGTNLARPLTRSSGSGMSRPPSSLCVSPTVPANKEINDHLRNIENHKTDEQSRKRDELDSIFDTDEEDDNSARYPRKTTSYSITSSPFQNQFKNIGQCSDASFKAGLLLKSYSDASPVSRQASKTSVNKISPLVSREDMHDKALVKSNKGYGVQKQSSTTWRIVPYDSVGNFSDILENVQSTFQQQKTEERFDTKKKKNQGRGESLRHHSPSQQESPLQQPSIQRQPAQKDIILNEKSTMQTIEEFLENREHIDKTEFDMVVRNLVATKSPEMFPAPHNNIPQNTHSEHVISHLGHLDFENSVSTSLPPRTLAASRFPVIGEKRFNPQHQSKGTGCIGQTRQQPNVTRQLSSYAFSRYLADDAFSGNCVGAFSGNHAGSVYSERKKTSGPYAGSLPNIGDSQARIENYDLDCLSDAEESWKTEDLISCFHGNENTNLPEIDYTDSSYSSNHLPPINPDGKALVSMGPVDRHPIAVIQREMSELDLFKGTRSKHLTQQSSVCSHGYLRSVCTLCIRPPSRGGRALMNWLNTKKMKRLKKQGSLDALKEGRMDNF